jgi:Zn-finger nucleic acid-binding protein
MKCPGCGEAMAGRALDGRYGRRIEIDLCHACASLWFDGAESLTLSSQAVLELFALIHDERAESRRPLGTRLRCPRCRQPLARTTDLQRSTRFGYWRCPAEHGRFITFVDFLREKNFVRPLAPRELEALRRNVKTMTCSSCGAPIDLGRDSACSYCHAPIAMLDATQVEKVIEELRSAEAARREAVNELPLRLLGDRAHVEHAFAELGRDPDWAGVSDSFGLIEKALGAVAGLMRGPVTPDTAGAPLPQR